MATTHYQTCSLCEATCGLAISVEDGRAVSVKGDKENPFSRGYICPTVLIWARSRKCCPAICKPRQAA